MTTCSFWIFTTGFLLGVIVGVCWSHATKPSQAVGGDLSFTEPVDQNKEK